MVGRPRLDGRASTPKGPGRPPGRPPLVSKTSKEGKASGSDVSPAAREAASMAMFKATGILPVGTKLPVLKLGDTDHQRAEVLAIRQRKDGKPTYYVHYEHLNKRLDEWVTEDRMDVTNMAKIQFPRGEDKADKRRKTEDGSTIQRTDSAMSVDSDGAGADASPSVGSLADSTAAKDDSYASPAPRSMSGKENQSRGNISTSKSMAVQQEGDGDEATEGDADATANASAAGSPSTAPLEELTFEEDLQRLRVGGSMTQRNEEVGRVKNINQIQFGKHVIDTWYFSPYPPEFENVDMVYICEFCLKYDCSRHAFERHRTKCTLFHPPGNEIYRKDSLSFFELDGHKQKTYCRNLCLISKLFLDHKTLYYDVDPFLFYVMTETDDKGCHIVGYFSKEKDSAQGYNLACILTLPQYQRKGYGKLLISFSYELSRIEKKVGSPEKPLSDLGLLSYRSFWFEIIMAVVRDMHEEISVDEISKRTCLTVDDVLHTLAAYNMLRLYKHNYIICITQKHRDDYDTAVRKTKRRIDPSCIQWTPPVFSSAQLRYL